MVDKIFIKHYRNITRSDWEKVSKYAWIKTSNGNFIETKTGLYEVKYMNGKTIWKRF